MAWDDGLSTDGSRIVIPQCGISYFDIIKTAGECRTIIATAKRLGVSDSTLRVYVGAYRLHHWFEGRTEPKCPTKITRRRLSYWLRQGMTRKDIAESIGCTHTHLSTMIRRYGLQDRFPNRGEASWMARRGHVGRDTEGRTASSRAWEDVLHISL